MVQSFRNADERFATEPAQISYSLDRANTETVQSYLDNLPSMRREPERISSLQKHLLSGIRDPFTVGCYSVRHEKATYLYGLDDPRTIREAYM